MWNTFELKVLTTFLSLIFIAVKILSVLVLFERPGRYKMRGEKKPVHALYKILYKLETWRGNMILLQFKMLQINF